MTTGYALVETDDDAAWDAAVDASPQGTVFSRSAYLRSLGLPFRRWLVRSGGQAVALVPAVEDVSGTCLVPPPLTPYQGLQFCSAHHALPRQRTLDELRIGEFAVAALTERYQGVAMALHWQLADVRPFLWHDYHATDRPHFVVRPRYTALLDLKVTDAARFATDARACRRQELRRAAACTTAETDDIERFIALYAATFARQGRAVDGETLAHVRRVTRAALEGGYGRLSACAAPDGIASMALFLHDRRRAYYLYAANEPELRASGAATKLMFDAIADAHRRGLDELDFVGVNSPQRGDFKLSFNPRLAPYFEVELKAH